MDAEEFEALVRDDLLGLDGDEPAGLGPAFAPTGDRSESVRFVQPFDDDQSALRFSSEGGRYWVATWTFTGRHTGRFLSFEPTGLDVEISGVTIYDVELQSFYRSIDWAAVLLQIGVGLTGRAVDATQRRTGGSPLHP